MDSLHSSKPARPSLAASSVEAFEWYEAAVSCAIELRIAYRVSFADFFSWLSLAWLGLACCCDQNRFIAW